MSRVKKFKITPSCVENCLKDPAVGANNARPYRYSFLVFLPLANRLRNIADLSDCVSRLDWCNFNSFFQRPRL